jgi:hypothetical protein
MSDRVSKLAAFVFQHGELASEILFRDLDDVGELPGIGAEEREAMNRVEPHLRETWIGVLSACRSAMWQRAKDHQALSSTMATGKTQDGKMWENGYVQLPLVDGWAAWCGVSLEPWGEPRYHLFAWVYTRARHRAAAEAAIAGKFPAMWRQENGNFVLTLAAPAEGETYAAVGARVADALWPLASAIGDAVRADKKQRAG